MARLGLGRGLAVLVAVLALACTSPTLPLPPPSTPLISLGSTPGTYRLSSIQGAEPNALVVVVNRRETLPPSQRVTGTIADAVGSWELVVVASPGDLLDLSQDTGSTRSPSTTVPIH
jgi:hypothetical protein